MSITAKKPQKITSCNVTNRKQISMKKTFEFLLYSNSNNNFGQRELHQKRGHLSSPVSLSLIFTPTSYVGVKVLTACACVCLTDAEIKVVKILVRRPNFEEI